MKRRALLEYDPETDLLNIDLQDPETPLVCGQELENGVIGHYGTDGSLVSLEIHDVSRRYAGEILKQNRELAKQVKELRGRNRRRQRLLDLIDSEILQDLERLGQESQQTGLQERITQVAAALAKRLQEAQRIYTAGEQHGSTAEEARES